jgi:hypothetical protein
VNVSATLKANTQTQTTEMMQPGMCMLDNPVDFPKATAVRVTTAGDARGDTALVQHASVFVVV